MISKLLLTASALLICGTAYASDTGYTLIIKDHKFSPESLEIPAGQKVRVTIINEDYTPEEFDSADLGREKLIAANSKGIVSIGPLPPGAYAFMGEFHEKTAKGTIVSK